METDKIKKVFIIINGKTIYRRLVPDYMVDFEWLREDPEILILTEEKPILKITYEPKKQRICLQVQE